MRSEPSIDTICSLMCAKQNKDLNCFEYEELLKSAKKAVLTYQSNVKKSRIVFWFVINYKNLDLSVFSISLPKI